MERHDYAFPFRIDATSLQAAQVPYATHVQQMIRQILLTSPGERTDLPEFGCGVRRLLFAPNSQSLVSTTQMVVQQALNRWLGTQIKIQTVTVTGPEDPTTDHEIIIQIEYELIETRTNERAEVRVL